MLIEVDGGVNRDTADSIKAAGANMLVAGTFVYKAEDQKEAISFLKSKFLKVDDLFIIDISYDR